MPNYSQHISTKEIQRFRRVILNWFKKHGRKFPWRNKSISNYKKAIAEVLLQRTQAATISKFWPCYFNRFPSWKSILTTELQDIEQTLKPIGLYRLKAKGLLRLAQEMDKRGGRFPKNKKELEQLPLIGHYNANAILTIIFNQPYPLLDRNMTRVLERYYDKKKSITIRQDAYLQELATRVVHVKNPKLINWAILDFAAIVCQARTPKCRECVLHKNCTFYAQASISKKT